METSYSAADLKVILNGNEIREEGYHLEKFELSFKENEHTKLVIGLEVKEKYKNEWNIYNRESIGEELGNSTAFAVILRERKYFAGIIQSMTVLEREAGDIYIEINAFSKSELLDRVKIYRAYQHPDIRYIDIVKNILSRYNVLGAGIEEDENNSVLSTKIRKGLIIQYYETDWEFLVRIISHLGLAVFNTENGGITIGFSKGAGTRKEWNPKNGNVGKTVDRENNIFYYLTSTEYFTLGDNIVSSQRDMGYVTEGNIGYASEKFFGQYYTKMENYTYEYIPNKNIQGAMIEGAVTAVPDSGKGRIAVMTVDFSGGLQKAADNKLHNRRKVEAAGEWIMKQEKRFIFPYTTPYSQTNTGYFCTPEKGDIVAVNFPTTEEHEGYVVWAVNSDGNLRFSNPNVRNYTLPIIKERETYFDFKLNYDKFSIYAEDIIDMKSNNIMRLKSENVMTMRSVNEYIMAVEEEMAITGKNLSVKSSNSKEVVLEKKSEIMEDLEGQYLSSLKILTKDMNTIAQTKIYIKSPQIIKKS